MIKSKLDFSTDTSYNRNAFIRTSRAKGSRRRPLPRRDTEKVKLSDAARNTLKSPLRTIPSPIIRQADNNDYAANPDTMRYLHSATFARPLSDGDGVEGDARGLRLTCPRLTLLHWRDLRPFRNAKRRTVFSLHHRTCRRPRRMRHRGESEI